MTNNQIGKQFLESFVDVATELLAYNKQNSNPPTPSLNDFSKSELREEDIIITTEEADQILNILNNLQEKLESKEEKIQKLQTQVSKKESKQAKSNQAHLKQNFKSELKDHAETLDLLTVLIQSGSACCELTGNLFRVYSDFIILLDDVNNLVKIRIPKIAAIKVIDPKNKKNNDCPQQDEAECDVQRAAVNNDKVKPKQDLQAV